jgi:hypothetical protein
LTGDPWRRLLDPSVYYDRRERPSRVREGQRHVGFHEILPVVQAFAAAEPATVHRSTGCGTDQEMLRLPRIVNEVVWALRSAGLDELAKKVERRLRGP